MEKHAQIVLSNVFTEQVACFGISITPNEFATKAAVEVEKHAHKLCASNFPVQDSPFAKMRAKNEFAKKAEDVEGQLFEKRTQENNEITNKILIKLYAIGYLLNNNITLSSDRIKFYTQQIKDLNLRDIKYDQLHSIVSEMQTETARAIDGEEVLKNIEKEIEIVQSKYELVKTTLQYAKYVKYSGIFIFLAGALAGVVLIAVNSLGNNVTGFAAALGGLAGALVVGGDMAIAGIIWEGKAKRDFEKTKKHLSDLKGELSKRKNTIRKNALDNIEEVEKKAKRVLGISD